MSDVLYENIGGKIKKLAAWTFIIEAIGAIITGIALAIDQGVGGYLVISFVGPIVAFVGSWLLYGFGELIEATCENRDITNEILQCVATESDENEPAPVTVVRGSTRVPTREAEKTTTVLSGGWECACGRANAPYVSTCVCGLTKHEAAKKIAQKNS